MAAVAIRLRIGVTPIMDIMSCIDWDRPWSEAKKVEFVVGHMLEGTKRQAPSEDSETLIRFSY